METEPAESHDSNPPSDSSETTEEPIPAVPTGETTPVWAQTEPVAPSPASRDAEVEAVDSEAEVYESAPPVAPTVPPKGRREKGDPDWSKPEGSSNGDAGKKTPEWARTVPTDPGEPAEDAVAEEATEAEDTVTPVEATASEAPIEPTATEPPLEPTATEPPIESTATEPPEVESEVITRPITETPKAVAADAMKSTWPPASESAPAPPEETDIWPPEPPTEHAMPAWPPPSELEEPVTPAQVIPSWPDSFDAARAAPSAQVPTVPVAPAVVAPAAASTPPTLAPVPPPTLAPVPPPSEPMPAPTKASSPPPPPIPPAPPAQAPPAPPASPPKPSAASATSQPVAPAQPGPPSRPVWAPKVPAETGGEVPPQTKPASPINVPAWAPRVPLAAEPGTPTWFSPKEQIPHTTAQPAAQPAAAQQPAPAPQPAPPVAGGQLPVAKVPVTPVQPAQPAQPGQPATAKPTWEVVNQPRKSGPHTKAEAGPTAEDRSYAEWFAWAKRGGAPASACHAAAQGAFKALSTGKDVTTAVQWATAAMSRPPENVSYTRQTYCAWFSLANIDLNLDQHRAHAFAMAAIHVLDAGQDAAAAHAAGLAAAGIR